MVYSFFNNWKMNQKNIVKYHLIGPNQMNSIWHWKRIEFFTLVIYYLEKFMPSKKFICHLFENVFVISNFLLVSFAHVILSIIIQFQRRKSSVSKGKYNEKEDRVPKTDCVNWWWNRLAFHWSSICGSFWIHTNL